ncbi:unnamed protein product [Phytophthora fragariaefolia]|uniref:Unnamed protein product n=1 Tax=Phytophthora fragariaefolia TaxID=1490495 RepID=A0A9W7D1I8_9STRA|nr:unnamed protein product [Phytophthora fragariaefolia]
MVFAISLLSDLDNIKMAMRVRRRKRRSTSSSSSTNQKRHRATLVAPYFSSVKWRSGPGVNIFRRKRTNDMLSRVSQFVFFVWGAMILVLHLFAESAPELPQCWMQVRPWITKQPSCSLLVLDCHEVGIRGKTNEIAPQWSTFDPASVTRAVARHCPALEIPSTLASFSNLNAIKVYNSTIVSWDDSAALTHSSHPKLMTLFLVRVNVPDGRLPVGLHATDFPQSVGDIEFCYTNLRSLPDDIDTKWPQTGSIYIEASELEEVPAALTRLAPFDLSLSMNPISELPAELFEQESIGYLSFGSTLISQLPETVEALSSQLYEINLSYNNLSFFWPWIDPIINRSEAPPLLLAGTPYCKNLEQTFAKGFSVFSSVPSSSANNEKNSLLANISVSNWATLKKGVSCEDQDKTWYPIDFEDEYSSIVCAL